MYSYCSLRTRPCTLSRVAGKRDKYSCTVELCPRSLHFLPCTIEYNIFTWNYTHIFFSLEAETYTFTWQKKAFSQVLTHLYITHLPLASFIHCVQREYEFYGDANNCTTALENRYNRDIAKLRLVPCFCTSYTCTHHCVSVKKK